MSEKRYPHVLRAVMESPWAILPGHLAVIRDIVEMRAAGEQFTKDEIEARLGSRGAPRRVAQTGAVAVIPVSGVIVPRATMFTDISGGTSVEGFRDSFMSAVSDPDVGAIVLDVNSPGGLADMLAELASTMRSARGSKPILAVANTMAASAAYWIASQADEVAVTPSGMAGSIGVFAAHEDLSSLEEKVGIKTTLISAGKFKTEGNPHEPLTQDARDHIQSLVEATYQAFTGDVAKGRGVPVEDVRSGFGEGRVFDAKRAVKLGIADRVATLDQTIGRAAEMAAGAVPATARADDGTVTSVVLYGSKPRHQLAITPDGGFSLVPAGRELYAGPIRPHSTATVDTAWDGPAAKANLANDRPETFRQAFAWFDGDAPDPDGDGYPDRKGDYKGIHHEVSSDGTVGAANVTACSQVIGELNGGRGGFDIPAGDRQGVWDHVAEHLRDAGREPPPLKSMEEIEIEAAGGDVSLIDGIEAVLCAADDLIEHGRALTTAKRERFETLRERLDAILQKPVTPNVALTEDEELLLLGLRHYERGKES